MMHDEIHHAIRLEITHADGFDPPGPIKRLHRPPSAMDIAIGLVDQVAIQILQLQAGQ